MDCLKSAAESRCECTRKWPHCLGVQAPLLTGLHPHPLFLRIQTGFLFEIFLYFFPDENRSAEFGLHQMHPTGSSSLPAHSIHLLSYLDDQPSNHHHHHVIIWMINQKITITTLFMFAFLLVKALLCMQENICKIQDELVIKVGFSFMA